MLGERRLSKGGVFMSALGIENNPVLVGFRESAPRIYGLIQQQR